jgi:hypothetical protein
MSTFPVIRTAIPKRRYQVGEYSVTLLGEVDSGDANQYEYVLAFVREGEKQPRFYVCSEKNPPTAQSDGSHRLRVINSAMSEVLSQADRWGDLDDFANEALSLGIQALGLTDETPYRLS